MSDHIDPALKEAIKWDEEAWHIGNGAIKVFTQSGSEYLVTNDGEVTGGTHLPNGGKLQGAVYRAGGPIRTKQVMIGLSMEIMRQPPHMGNVVITSPVKTILDG